MILIFIVSIFLFGTGKLKYLKEIWNVKLFIRFIALWQKQGYRDEGNSQTQNCNRRLKL